MQDSTFKAAATAPTGAQPDRRAIRWFLIALLVIGGVVNYLDRGTLSVANTTIAEDFGLSTIQMGATALGLRLAVRDRQPAGRLPRGPVRPQARCTPGPRPCGRSSPSSPASPQLFRLPVRRPRRTRRCRVTVLHLRSEGVERWFHKDERALPLSIVNTGSQIANAIAPPLLTFLMLTHELAGHVRRRRRLRPDRGRDLGCSCTATPRLPRRPRSRVSRPRPPRNASRRRGRWG